MKGIGGVVSNAYQNRRCVFAKSQYQTIIGAREDKMFGSKKCSKECSNNIKKDGSHFRKFGVPASPRSYLKLYN